MQLSSPQRRGPTNLNHTIRAFEVKPAGGNLPTHYRGTSSGDRQKQADRRSEGRAVERNEEQHVMAVHPILAASTTATPPGAIADAPPQAEHIRNGPTLLRKTPSLTIHAQHPYRRQMSDIPRRHSWTSTLRPPYRVLEFKSTIMEEAEGTSPPRTPHRATGVIMERTSTESAGIKTTYLTTRPGATFDMAYFLRHTGPPPPARKEEPKEDLRKPADRKRGRNIFKKRKEAGPEAETPTALVEEPKSSVFVPPEGVEQKFTAKGNKYLQIVAHPDLQDLGTFYELQFAPRARRHSSPRPPHNGAVSSDALDSWISTLSFHNQQSSQDLGVRPPTAADMHAVESMSTIASHNRPRTPQSYVSEAKSQLPSAEDSFGLSIIDGAVEQPYINSVFVRSEALCSNPPSNPVTPTESSHEHQVSVDTAERPLLDKRVDSAGDHSACVKEHAKSPEQYNEKEKFDRRSTEVLAGQGLRRPFREHEPKEQQVEAIPELYPAAVIQERRNREAAVRARKIKALQQARKSIDRIVKEQSLETPPSESQRVNAFEQPLRQSKRESSITTTTTTTTMTTTTPNRHVNRMTKTMLVAEQIPQPRGRHARKPARLVLRENSITRHSRAFRPDDEDARQRILDGSPPSTTTPAATRLQRKSKTPPPPPPPHLPPKSSSRTTPTTSFFTPHSGTKHFSTPLLSSQALTPQAVTATASLAGGLRTSVCSSHTSQSKEARLEARLEALERENRLLEAALMAVLKTSGTLNRCPCVVLRERSDVVSTTRDNFSAASAATAGAGVITSRFSSTPSQSRAETPLPNLKRVTEEDVSEAINAHAEMLSSSASSTNTRRGSVESNGSGISALEVYLRTKIGADIK